MVTRTVYTNVMYALYVDGSLRVCRVTVCYCIPDRLAIAPAVAVAIVVAGLLSN